MLQVRVVGYFVAVAELGSVSRAAQHVLVSQPSLSRQLRGLERTLGVQLFIRDGGALRLSAAGEQFLPIARDLLRRHEAAQASMRYSAGAGGLALTVAATPTTIVDVIAPFVAQVDLHGIVLLAQEAVPETAYRGLDSGQADLAMTNEPPPRHHASTLVIRFPVFAYVSRAHPWAKLRSITLAELAQAPLITSPPSGTSRVLRQMDDAGLSYRIAYEVPVPQMAQALAAAGHGVAVLSDDPRFELHPLLIDDPGGALTVPMYAAWDARHYAVRDIDACVGRLIDYCRSQWPAAAEDGV
jgi:DNA-binding transcriptional LysR family regulator